MMVLSFQANARVKVKREEKKYFMLKYKVLFWRVGRKQSTVPSATPLPSQF